MRCSSSVSGLVSLAVVSVVCSFGLAEVLAGTNIEVAESDSFTSVVLVAATNMGAEDWEASGSFLVAATNKGADGVSGLLLLLEAGTNMGAALSL